MSVVLFHAGLRFFPGGFVGVDVFFVISGYLITSLIAPEIEAGQFSFSRFYKRRILRIFPALFAMLLGTTILGYLYLLPSEFRDFVGSLVAASFSVSNALFAYQTGYFDAPALAKPLLHTWSLGVEEQFYLLLPIFMVLASRFFRSQLRNALAAVAVVSLIAGGLVSLHHHEVAFFWTPFRLWELALGGLGSLGFFPAMRTGTQRNIGASLGLALIAGAVLIFSSETPWIVSTLTACLGALLILLAGETGSTLVGRCLALKPVVFIGLISYSLYLWHWPIIVFQQSNSMVFQDSASYASKFGLVAFSIALATLSWWFIERPFRHGYAKTAPPRIFLAASMGMASAWLIAGAVWVMSGASFRFPASAVAVSSYLDYRPDKVYRQDQCYVSYLRDYDSSNCLGRSTGRPNYLLIGDSHAAHLWHGLSSVFDSINVMQATASGCKPLIVPGVFEAAECRSLINFVFNDYLVHDKIDKLLIAGQWKESDLPKIEATLDYLKSIGVEIVLIVQYDYSLPRLLANAIRYGDPRYVDKHRAAGIAGMDRAMSAVAASKTVDYVSLLDTLCRADVCQTYASDSIPLQFDYGHLTGEGSVLVAEHLRGSALVRRDLATMGALN
jgi:peptidoglycan/LPS O-acetylase OafA/YrhL